MIALVLVWTGSASAGELKIQIPINEFEQIQSRLDALEKENTTLRQEARSMERSVQTGQVDDPAMKSRLDALEAENNRLRQDVEAQAGSGEMVVQSDSETADLHNRLSELESQSRRQKQEIKTLKQGKAFIESDTRSAKQLYSSKRSVPSFNF